MIGLIPVLLFNLCAVPLPRLRLRIEAHERVRRVRVLVELVVVREHVVGHVVVEPPHQARPVTVGAPEPTHLPFDKLHSLTSHNTR